MDEDLDEMRRLRRSRGYAEHQQQQESASIMTSKASQLKKAKHDTSESWSSLMHQELTDSASSSSTKHGDMSPVYEQEYNSSFSRPTPPVSSISNAGASSKVAPSVQDLNELAPAIAEYAIPITHEAILKGHEKAVSAVSIEPSGSRMFTGAYDYRVRLWDFNGMDKHLKSFRETEPESGHQITEIALSYPHADRFMACTASARLQIFDRDGKSLSQSIKGDMYIRDMKHTRGHVMSISGGQWHSTVNDIVMTSSLDGTVRLWDVERIHLQCKEVIKVKTQRGGRLAVTAATMSHNSKIIAAACKDGTLQIYTGGKFLRPKHYIKNAHEPETETSRLTFSADDQTLLSRGGDNTLKIWDLRNTKQSLKVIKELPNFFAQTDVIFSPNGALIVTCTSAKRKEQEKGSLVFYDSVTFNEVQRVSVSDASAVRCVWHHKLNQLFVGCADHSIHGLYDPMKSKQGMLMCVGRKARKKDPLDFHQTLDIVAPHTLPMFKKERGKKRQHARDAIRMAPEVPISGRGAGGQIGSSWSKYMLEGIVKDPQRDLDPREAILAYDEKTKKDPVFFGKAYEKSQPVTIFAPAEDSEADTDVAADTATQLHKQKKLDTEKTHDKKT